MPRIMTLNTWAPQILVTYFSLGGNTRKMAETLAEAVKEAGCEAVLEPIGEASLAHMGEADGVLMGSPCHFGSMAVEAKKLLDDSLEHFDNGMLVGKAAGVFGSTGSIGGGGEMALIGMTMGLMSHGMVVQGVRSGGHFGPLAIGEPDERALAECRAYGAQFAYLVKTLSADLY